jgi:protein tyrosine phosphatase (PTP) superfamily phosphohydrolase (DUF442 family)
MADLSQILNYLEISPNLLTAGQPTAEQFMAVKDAGVQCVINLAMPYSPDFIPNEDEVVRHAGMDYIYIGIEWEHPTVEGLQAFFDAMDGLKGQKVLVHCAKNMRVSSFVYLYRVLKLGEPQEVCRADLEKIWTPNPTWEEFIQKNDPLLPPTF